MSYLYGDSSPSTLKTNFIEFLRDAIEFAAQVLSADQRIREGGNSLAEQQKIAEEDIARLDAVGALVESTLGNAVVGEALSPAARCVESIRKSAADVVRGEIDRVRANLKRQEAQLGDKAGQERAHCVQALDALLGKHDLPDWSIDMHLEQEGATRYQARMHGKAPFGLAVTLDLEIPPAHLLAHTLRINRLVERLEVQAPEAGGWLRKEVKLRPQRLEKEFLTGLHLGPGEMVLKLRANADGTGPGCDLQVKAPRALFTRAGESAEAPFELGEADAQRIIELAEKLTEACNDLQQSKRRVVEAFLDGVALSQHGDPKVIAERILETITPAVQEIAKRSLSPTELVLKRQLDSGRREEIFISREELKQKLAGLSDAQRALFAPLGLADPLTPAPMPWKPSPSAILPKPLLQMEESETKADPVIPRMIDDTPMPKEP